MKCLKYNCGVNEMVTQNHIKVSNRKGWEIFLKENVSLAIWRGNISKTWFKLRGYQAKLEEISNESII